MGKRQKIVITGALGYIGTELCQLYSGESRYKQIIALDNRFISERVKQLCNWGIEFVHGDILDVELMKKILKDVDIVHHLAGITDVAYTKTESNAELDARIKLVGITGTENVIYWTRNVGKVGAKIIFPSTHVVFEGLTAPLQNIQEHQTPVPVLSYSQVKVENERQLQKSGLNYTILRLGSVYGYSTDTMRIGIMPNLFSKITSQEGTIKLFGGGKQLKSLVHIKDVARCFKFFADQEQERYGELYHCVSYNGTVKDVANICKSINPAVTIVETDDEVPNEGYTLSNEKLLKWGYHHGTSGFSFLYDDREGLKTAIETMIWNWSTSDKSGLEYIIRGQDKFIDDRGEISNYELPEPINLVGLITSKAGSVRANHYHPIQEQKALLVSGQYISVIKDLAEINSPVYTQLINPGDCVVTRPNVAHTMVFTKDSTFLNLVNGERKHENYGVTHTLPHVLVDNELKERILDSYRTTCRVCGKGDLKTYASLGLSPLANNLSDSPVYDQIEKYPLDVNYCSNCHNSQLGCVVPPEKMFDNYLYKTSTTAVFRKHFKDAAEKYIKQFKLNSKSFVVDFGSNDGTGLIPFKDVGIKVLGIEPAANIADIARNNGIETVCRYIDVDFYVDFDLTNTADLVLASNVFAHNDDLSTMADIAYEFLTGDGVFIIEVQYIGDTIKDLTFDNIYHEHVNYWSLTSMVKLLGDSGFYVSDVEHIDTHGGSIRVYARKYDTSSHTVKMFLEKEKEMGLTSYDTYVKFGKRIETVRNNVRDNMAYLKSLGNPIIGYGSPAKATTALNFYGIDNSDISFILEDNELKVGKYVPGVNIPIRSKEGWSFDVTPFVIIMAWNFAEYIVQNNANLNGGNVAFLTIYDLRMPPDKFKNFISMKSSRKEDRNAVVL